MYLVTSSYDPGAMFQQLAAVAHDRRAVVEDVLRQFGYRFITTRQYLKALADAIFNPKFLSALTTALYSRPKANAFGGEGGWGGGFLSAAGGLFNLGGSLATGITGSRAAQAQAEAAKAAAKSQLDAAFYGYQATLAGSEAALKDRVLSAQGQERLIKIVLIGGSIVFVLVIAGIIIYKRMT